MMNGKTRIQLQDSMADVVVKMSEGNPGAISVIMQLLDKGATIDPDAAMGGFGHVLGLDTLNLYGPSIWMLYKDVCGEDIIKTAAVLRGHQLGIVDGALLRLAVANHGDGLDVDRVLEQVQSELPNFGKEAHG